ncbi:MAG: outer membrane protein assembly factor BamA [Alphaproteobacteria bacterium]
MRVLVLVVLLIGALAPWRPASAQGVIGAIEVTGNQRIEADTVRSYMGFAAGEAYDPVRVDRALKALFATGLFADVSIRRQGDTVVVSVVENPIINRLAFEGNRRISDDVLESEVQLRPRVVYTRSRVQADVNRLVQVYRRSGRFAATVEPKVIQLPQNRVDLAFEINEGDLTGVERIDFIGNREFSDGDLRGAVATKESRWYRFFTSDDSYDPDRLTLDRELLRKYYLRRGYADFRVVSAVAELSRDRSDFFITFTVEEGELYKFGKIELTTSLRDFDPEAIREQLKTFEGETYDAEAIEKSIEEITFELGRLGYAFVDVRPRVNRDRETRTIAVTYEIAEGPRVYVERINITGNVRTLDKVIRREFRLAEGDAFNTAKLRRSRQRIQGLGFFDKVEVTQQEGTQPDRVVINADVQERSTGELSFGAGISTSEALIGDVSIRERNLLGRGQDLRVGLTLSSRRRQVDLSFTEPYFLDRPVAAGIDIFNVRRDLQSRSSFNEENLGFRLRTNYQITEQLRQGVRYTLREDKITDIDSTTSPFIRREEGASVTSAIGYDLVFDGRDQPFEPNSGIILRFSQDFAGFGGDVRHVRSSAAWDYYYPLTEDFVASVSLNAGHVIGIDDDVRVNDRFFIGGDSFRGFESGGVGPRDRTTDDSIGGNVFYVVGTELRFPLGFASEFGVKGRVFLEAGTLTDPDVSGPDLLDSDLIRLSGGVGLSWNSPFGPIRVDLAKPAVKEDFDQEELFRFSFGTRF